MDSPRFFIPGVVPEKQESVLEKYAKAYGCPVPSPDQRVYSLTFDHDRVEWTATVGDHLRGTSRRTVRSRGKRIERTVSHSDPAVVRVILSDSSCYKVFTDGGLAAGTASRWANPFLAGMPQRVDFFSDSI